MHVYTNIIIMNRQKERFSLEYHILSIRKKNVQAKEVCCLNNYFG